MEFFLTSVLVIIIISLPIGFVLFSFLLVQLLLNQGKSELIKKWMPYVGALCIAPGIIFFFDAWDIIFNDRKVNNYDYSFFMLLSTFVSSLIFFLWIIFKKIGINFSKIVFIIWFLLVLFLIYPFSCLMMAEIMAGIAK